MGDKQLHATAYFFIYKTIQNIENTYPYYLINDFAYLMLKEYTKQKMTISQFFQFVRIYTILNVPTTICTISHNELH